MITFGSALRFGVLPALVLLGTLYSMAAMKSVAESVEPEPPQEKPCRDAYYDGDHYFKVTCEHPDHHLVIEGSAVKCLCERGE